MAGLNPRIVLVCFGSSAVILAATALSGLNVRHTRSDFARACREGIFYEVKRCVEVLAESTPVESLRVSGNIVNAPESLQLLADIFGLSFVGVPEKSPAAIGAALLARDASTVPEPKPRARSRPATQPTPSAVQAYERLYRDYLGRTAGCAS